MKATRGLSVGRSNFVCLSTSAKKEQNQAQYGHDCNEWRGTGGSSMSMLQLLHIC